MILNSGVDAQVGMRKTGKIKPIAHILPPSPCSFMCQDTCSSCFFCLDSSKSETWANLARLWFNASGYLQLHYLIQRFGLKTLSVKN